jgi:hypothetical protein
MANKFKPAAPKEGFRMYAGMPAMLMRHFKTHKFNINKAFFQINFNLDLDAESCFLQLT